jgi:hypothetical protein
LRDEKPIATLSSICLENPSRGRAASLVSDTKPAAPADAVFFSKGRATAAGFRVSARPVATPQPKGSAHEIHLFQLLKHVGPNTAKSR